MIPQNPSQKYAAVTAASAGQNPEQRYQDLMAFVARAGWGDADVNVLRQDASIRCYYRLTRANGDSAIMMDARPPMEDTTTFEFMDQKLTTLGFSVPKIYAADHTLGIILMEDFGDNSFFNLITQQKKNPKPLLELAVDVLVHKYNADPAIALDGSVAYSDEYWLFRVEQFLQHYMPLVRKITVDDTARAEYLHLFKDALDRAHQFPNVLLHGDFVVQNLMYLPERQGVKALGLLDFQDMTDARGNMCGTPAFDLAFLVHDVRADYDESMMAELKARFIEKAQIKDVVQFEYEYAAIVAAQAAKCLGLFARFGHANGRTEYLPFLAFCIRNLRAAFKHPGLADLKAWFDKYAPMD